MKRGQLTRWCDLEDCAVVQGTAAVIGCPVEVSIRPQFEPGAGPIAVCTATLAAKAVKRFQLARG